jgi:hypothetical protein
MPKTLFVILDREHIGEVMRGERHELPVIDPAPVGSKVALKVARNRRPTVIVEVTGCEPDPEGHTLTVRTIPLEHEPRLLAADSSKGYTDKPFLAVNEEPEAVDEITLALYRERADRRHDKTARARARAAQLDRELLTVEERMTLARQAARLNHVDVSNDMHALRQMLARNANVEPKLRVVERVAYREAA